MNIYLIIFNDGYDSGDCFIEAYDSEEAAEERVEELNSKRDNYYVREYELNKRMDA